MTTDSDAAALVEAWVYSDPERSLGYQLWLTFHASSRALERRTLPRGVTSGQWSLLRELWLEDGLSQRQLSRRVGMRDPSTAILVASLVRSGLAVREPDAADGRRVRVRLTPHGRDLAATLLPMAAALNSRATAGLSPGERDVLMRCLRRIIENLAMDRDP